MKKWLAVKTNHQDIMLTYNFNSNKVRVVILDDDKPYFVVEDICEILKVPIERLSEEERITHTLDDREVILTSEFGLYDSILDSVGEREFKCWMLKEVLPTVREVAEAESISSQELIYALAIRGDIAFDEKKNVSYFNIKAVMKLTGISDQVIKGATKNPKSRVGKLFYSGIPTLKGQSTISRWISGEEKLPDSIITRIIEYYAFDDVYERAKNTYRAFAPMGIRNWVKEAVQYIKKDPAEIDPREVLASIDDKLSLIQQTVQELSQQFPVE